MLWRCLLLLSLAGALLAPSQARAGESGGPPGPAPLPPPAGVSARLWDARGGAWLDWEPALERLARADVVLVGELHDHPPAQALQLALLAGLQARRPGIALGLEAFERDVQADLDGYLAGALSEEAFLARARPWPGYPRSHRPLVELARRHGLTVLATNAPRPMAAQVARGGLAALAGQPPHLRRLRARRVEAPQDAYLQRFAGQMAEHAHGHAHGQASGQAPGASAGLLRLYEAQCLKDDTMAESLADHLESAGPGAPPLLHVNGAFHTDFGLGLAARVRARCPGLRVEVISLLPTGLDPDPGSHAGRAEWLWFYPWPGPAPGEGPSPR